MFVKFKSVFRALFLIQLLIMAVFPSLSFAEEHFKGRLVADLVGKISSETTGERSVRVEELLVRKGDRVSKGDLLARLSVEQLSADRLVALKILEEAQAEISVARSNLAEARLVLDRQAGLKNSPAFRGAAFDDAQARFHTAESRLLSAQSTAKRREAEVARIDLEIKLSDIVAPHDGIVVGVFTNVGSAVTQRNPDLMSLLDLSRVEIEVEVPDDKIAFFQPNKRVLYSLKDGDKQSARVRAIMPQLSEHKDDQIVRLQLDADTLPADIYNNQPVTVFIRK